MLIMCLRWATTDQREVGLGSKKPRNANHDRTHHKVARETKDVHYNKNEVIFQITAFPQASLLNFKIQSQSKST